MDLGGLEPGNLREVVLGSLMRALDESIANTCFMLVDRGTTNCIEPRESVRTDRRERVINHGDEVRAVRENEPDFVAVMSVSSNHALQPLAMSAQTEGPSRRSCTRERFEPRLLDRLRQVSALPALPFGGSRTPLRVRLQHSCLSLTRNPHTQIQGERVRRAADSISSACAERLEVEHVDR